MLKKYLYVVSTIVLLSCFQISLADSGTYKLTTYGKTFDITYKLDGSVISMGIDQESTSLLIGTTNVSDTVFEIGFSSELLSATNGEFIVLVDGLETDYTILYNNGNPTIMVPIETDTEEVEVIGTSAIPEFPLGVMAVMGTVTCLGLVLCKTSSVFKW
jgi:hypothetical protein